MSDDLVKRLWESDEASALTNQAARRIEALEAALAEKEAEVARLRGVLDYMAHDKSLTKVVYFRRLAAVELAKSRAALNAPDRETK